MWKPKEGSTAQLLFYSACYFALYVATGVLVKYFTELGPTDVKVPKFAFQWYSTVGGVFTCLMIVAILRWARRFESMNTMTWAGIRMPREFAWMIPSGICTAIIIPGTTMMYSFKGLSVMVAMVIMRGCVIIIGRAVDAIQLRQGILKRRVYWQEDAAAVAALAGVGVVVFWEKAEGIPFWQHPVALVTLVLYVVAYAIRIYIMNYYKNTRTEVGRGDNRGFFGVEQVFASLGILAAAAVIAIGVHGGGWMETRSIEVAEAMAVPRFDVVTAGIPFGLSAFFSVFLLMFKGRPATFATLVNRLASLMAGTVATLILWKHFGGKQPEPKEWAALACVLVAVGFLTWAERRRRREQAA